MALTQTLEVIPGSLPDDLYRPIHLHQIDPDLLKRPINYKSCDRKYDRFQTSLRHPGRDPYSPLLHDPAVYYTIRK